MWRTIGWIVVGVLALIGLVWLFSLIVVNNEYSRICVETCGQGRVSSVTAFHCKCRENITTESQQDPTTPSEPPSE